MGLAAAFICYSMRSCSCISDSVVDSTFHFLGLTSGNICIPGTESKREKEIFTIVMHSHSTPGGACSVRGLLIELEILPPLSGTHGNVRHFCRLLTLISMHWEYWYSTRLRHTKQNTNSSVQYFSVNITNWSCKKLFRVLHPDIWVKVLWNL